jgi:hypothetical protein
MIDQPRSKSLLRGLAIAAFGAALAYLFFGEHRVHLLGYLPFLLILLCPLLHMTMHGGHRGHGEEPPAREGGAPHQHPR